MPNGIAWRGHNLRVKVWEGPVLESRDSILQGRIEIRANGVFPLDIGKTQSILGLPGLPAPSGTESP